MDNHDIFLWLLMLFDDDEAEQRPDVNIAPVAMFMAFHRRDSVPRVDNFAEVTVPTYSMDDFRMHFRVTRPTMEVIVRRIANNPGVPVAQIRGKAPVDCAKQVMICLWYLGNEESYYNVSDRLGISKSTTHDVVWRICLAFCHLMEELIVWPKSEVLVTQTEAGFREISGLPGIIGAIDGSHINIIPPDDDEQSYYNRKKRHSIQVQAVCDHNLMFTNVYAGWPGSTHDGRVFRNSPLHDVATNNRQALFQGNTYIIGDSAYAIRSWLLATLKDNGNLTPVQRNFSRRLSKARVVIERAFGLLKGRWRRLKLVPANVEKIPNIIVACCVLHNLCLLEEDEVEDFMDMDNDGDDGDREPILPPQPGGQQLQTLIVNMVAALPQWP